jgi:hypothetical protein
MTIAHSSLTDPELHEPKGIASAAANKVYVSDGAGSGDWTEFSAVTDALCLDIADGSADTSYYVVTPYAGTITKLYTVIDGAVSTADITVQAKIGGTNVTNGLITIATAASAAGDVDSATPTAANTVTEGGKVEFAVAGGGSGGSPRIHLIMLVERT